MYLTPESPYKNIPEFRFEDFDQNLLLDIYAENLINRKYKDYPTQENRLFLDHTPYNGQGLIALPNFGPWVVGKIYPEREEKYGEIISMIGYPKHCNLDADYRPLHPLWREMVSRPNIGGLVGRGFFWGWGANYTADSAVTIKNSKGEVNILLIKRGDSGEWALPGGFINHEETTKKAALRELTEESGLVLNSGDSKESLLYSGLVLDSRTTLHAWTETTLWHFGVESDEIPEVTGSDDAMDAKWFNINDLPIDLTGAHTHLLNMVLNSRALEKANH